MSVFRRRRRSEDAVEEVAEDAKGTEENDGVEEDSEADAPWPAGVEPAPRPDGPWDVTELEDPQDGRVDLGGLLIPGVEGMELRVEVAGDSIVAATVVLGASAVQLQAFAAPRYEPLWGEIREEIAGGIGKQGGTVDVREGVLGWEVHAQVPVQLPNGGGGLQQVRFVGCDGPRWFLRGVISGQAAAQPEAAAVLEQVFRATAVVRGEGPMAPRDPIVLKLPEDAQMVPEGGGAPVTVEGDAPPPPANRFAGQAAVNPFERGPEIAERR